MTDTDASSGFLIRFAKNSVHNIAIKHYFKEVTVMKKQVIIDELDSILESLRRGIYGTDDEFEMTGKDLIDGYNDLRELINKLKKES